jgi:hypothetical protein
MVRNTPINKTERKERIGIDVPFYHQSFDFTCGPSCILMAMRYFDPRIRLAKEHEIDIWREANLIEAYATSHYGLALAAYRRGFRARTHGNAQSIRLLDCMCRSCRIEMDRESRTIYCGLAERPVRIHDHRLCLQLDPENRKFALALLSDLQTRCKKAGIINSPGHVGLDDLPEWLARGWVPIVLVDSQLTGEDEAPHWVVVTRIDSSSVTFHDPLSESGNTVKPITAFLKHLGYRGTTSAVIVEGKHDGHTKSK